MTPDHSFPEGGTVTPEAATTPEPTSSPTDPPVAMPRARSRPTVEFLLILLMAILVARAFAAEAYIVPTGSMAPTLLGMHRDLACPNCGKRFSLGMDDEGRVGRAVCPNCGSTEMASASTTDALGDRLLVQKYLFDFRPPRRWEIAVFQNPSDPSEAYVKRVVGLPGESILLWGGDVYIDGRIARKTLEESRSLAQVIYDHNFTPKDIARYPRWTFRRGDPRASLTSGWSAEGSRFKRSAVEGDSKTIDWIEYRHWQADRGAYGPIRDFTSYNGADVPGENRVRDLIASARVTLGPGCTAAVLRVDSGSERFVATFPADFSAPIEVRRNGRKLATKPAKSAGTPKRSSTSTRLVEVAVVDHRLSIAVDGQAAIEAVDFDDFANRPAPPTSPVAIGVVGSGTAEVRDLKLARDVFYTEALAQTPRRPFGVEVPYQLSRDEYFVLGDNSPVSNDSRFWLGSPVVTGGQLLGKPFLVHLPSRAMPLRVFGRDIYWIPDPREIRYIR